MKKKKKKKSRDQLDADVDHEQPTTSSFPRFLLIDSTDQPLLKLSPHVNEKILTAFISTE